MAGELRSGLMTDFALERVLLEAVAGNDRLVLLLLDCHGRLVDWNRAAATFYAFEDDQTAGMPVTGLMPPESGPEFRRRLEQIVAAARGGPGARSSTLEGARITRSGERREVWSTMTAIVDGGAEARRVVLLEHDITAVRQDRYRLDSYLDASPDAIVIVDREGSILRFNQQAEALTGYAGEELRWANYETLLPQAVLGRHRAYHDSFYRKASSREMAAGRELTLRHKSGDEIPVQISLTPVTVAQETTVLVQIRDTRRERDFKRSLAESRDEAERHLRAKSRFLAAASHDLRQPLQAINMYLGVLESQAKKQQRHDTIERIRGSIDSINKLLNGLLDLSKLESGAITPQLGKFPIAELLERVHSNASGAAKQKRQTLSLLHCSAVVRSDRDLLEQLLANLVSNAIRYTPEEGHIVIGCRRRKEQLEVQVLDNGMGIEPGDRERIFDEYVSISNAESGSDGAGLGLAIVSQIAGLLDHQLTVVSEPGRGSRFGLRLPRMPRDRQERREAKAPPKAPEETGEACLLLLEDNAEVLASTRLFLESQGFRVLAARGIAAAERQLEGGAVPDLVISDYSLGKEQNGLEAIRGLRARFRRSIPAILVSGHTSAQLQHEASLESCPLIHKPLDPQRLLRTVSELLQEASAAEGGGSPGHTG